MDALADIYRRLAVLERQTRLANKELVGTVTANDGENNRIKVACPDVYGATGESPWLLSRSSNNGPSRGEVWTPKLGDSVSFKLRDGNPDVGEYWGGPRDANSLVPEEFQDPNVNGRKTESGIIETFDDNTGDYSIETAEGGKIIIHKDGTIDTYGVVVNTHSPTNLNSDNAVYGVVTGSPQHMCPFMGKPHFCSATVKAAE
jgi:phage baseplate assembly protein gpV